MPRSGFVQQGFPFQLERIEHLLSNYRVLVVSDEIHHCSNNENKSGNSWGSILEATLHNQARFILTLSGTPWRSDKTKIALASYLNSPIKIDADYIYGLRDAVLNKVCRPPKITLVDHEQFQIMSNETESTYSSFQQAIEDEAVSYRQLINQKEIYTKVIALTRSRLMTLRRTNKRSAGLVVAASVEHAYSIAEYISSHWGDSVAVVNHNDPNSHDIIDGFQYSDQDWIVSVGMVSEGTDIPRLQVCCYLSAVRTELYFRQVLGRVLRIDQSENEEGWIFALAEPQLKEFANRIADDLPDDSVLIKDIEKSNDSDELMEKVYSLLGNDGYLYINIRVGSGIDILTLWEDSNLYPVEHNKLLSIEGIKILLNNSHFILKELHTPGVLDVVNILESKSNNIPRFLKYLKDSNNITAIDEFQIFLQKNLLSSFATVIAQKGLK